ncbi:MAG: FAD/NAD(P)-binding oxidoreductase [Thermaerobacter sp.]|nr:FAD/NAD(P)-binding oxidoreductase [Thermaerobacter sp.]
MLRAVVLGSRFGGLAVLTWLRRLFPPSDLHVTVVDQWEEMVFRPGLVHAMDQSPQKLVPHVTINLRHFWQRHKIQAVHDTIVAVDPQRRMVHTTVHPPIPYDVLYIATGSTPKWDAIEGLDRHRAGICEGYLARHTAAINQRQHQGRFVFAAGPIFGAPQWTPAIHVGCECPLIESALLWDQHLRRIKQRGQAEITVVTPSSQIAEMAGPAAQHTLTEILQRRDINVVTNAQYVRVTDTRLELRERTLPLERIIWIPPQGGSAWLTQSNVADVHGWVPVTDHLQHPRWPDIYAVGDIVSQSWPKMGHSAMVQARIAVHHWAHTRQKRKTPPMAYNPQLLWVLEDSPGEALFVLSNVLWGGDRERVWHHPIPYWAKQLFQWSYVIRAGALPIMP